MNGEYEYIYISINITFLWENKKYGLSSFIIENINIIIYFGKVFMNLLLSTLQSEHKMVLHNDCATPYTPGEHASRPFPCEP